MFAMSYARIATIASLVTLLLAAFFLATRGLNFAVDFTGGTIIEVHYPQAVATKSVQERLARAGFSDTSVSGQNADPVNLFIVFRSKEDVPPVQLTQEVLVVLRADQPSAEVISIDVITPQVGREILKLGSVTLAVTLIVVSVGVTIYLALRFGWPFARSMTLTNTCATVSVLALFLIAFTIFQWEFSILALLAMACLGIVSSALGAVRGFIAGQSLQEIGRP
jgi:preprotein translocase subunit SecF